MAKQNKTVELFKNLPRSVKPSAGGKPKTDEETEPPVEIPTEEPEEFPLGEYETPPQVIEDLPQPVEPPSESGSPPPEESPPEVEIVEPEQEEEPVDPDAEEDEDLPPTPSAAVGRVDEMEMLKQRALLMGVKFSNNIGLDALRIKVQARLDGDKAREAAASLIAGVPVQQEEQLPVKTDRQLMWEQEMRLVRLRITNLDPKKKDLPGEIFTVANKLLGAVKKFIPYGEATDNGYHVPYIIYRQLREREFLNIKTRKDRQGRTIVETGMVREFALEELPPLTQQELNRLAASQAASAGMSN